jgi:hypothetical protein
MGRTCCITPGNLFDLYFSTSEFIGKLQRKFSAHMISVKGIPLSRTSDALTSLQYISSRML